MHVFLLHGMGRTPLSMLWLAARLRRAGHSTTLFGYRVSREPLTAIAARLARSVHSEVARHTLDRYAVIGHSLGNVITRLASPALPSGFTHFVMLAPPNRSPALSRALRRNPLYRVLTGDAGQRLADAQFFEALPAPPAQSLIIAGQTSVPFLPYRGGPSDGVVGLDETELPGVRREVVDAAHTFIMNHRSAVRLALELLSEPAFAQARTTARARATSAEARSSRPR